MEGVNMKAETSRTVGFILLTSIATIIILVIISGFLIGIHFDTPKEGIGSTENPSTTIDSKEEEARKTLYYLDF